MQNRSKAEQNRQHELPAAADKGTIMVSVTRKKTGHLIEVIRDDGSKDLRWDWNKLLEEVRAATAGKVLAVDTSVETKTKKSAATKSPAKKPAAKKPTAKKKTSKK